MEDNESGGSQNFVLADEKPFTTSTAPENFGEGQKIIVSLDTEVLIFEVLRLYNNLQSTGNIQEQKTKNRLDFTRNPPMFWIQIF